MIKETYILGKCDYYNTGRKINECTLDYELIKGRFSMSANVRNSKKTDIIAGGQCVDEVVAFFPEDTVAQEMLAIWKEWHLNDMKAGTPAQEKWLAENAHIYKRGVQGQSYYEWACKALKNVGLNPDTHEGKPYSYGSSWLQKEITPDIRMKIIKWGEEPQIKTKKKRR